MWMRSAILAALVVGAAEPALAAPAAGPGEPVPVIIVLEAPPTAKAAATLAELRARGQAERTALIDFLTVSGASQAVELWMINAVAATVSPALVAVLEQRPGVAEVRPDGVVQEPVSATADGPVVEWNVARVAAPDLWARGLDGSGAVIGVMGGGVDVLHPDLAARWRTGSGGWWDPYDGSSQPFDLSGHDTAVAGIAVGGSAGGTAIGVAPGAQWIAARIFGSDNRAAYSTIHAAFQWFADPDGDPATKDAPDIVNASWSFGAPGTCDREFEADVEALRQFGIAVVFSAGNTGPAADSSVSPANYPSTFGVGATDAADAVAGFSGRGPSACDGRAYPDLAAPGVAILTADDTAGGFFILSYQQVDGTSAAAPHIAGAMALLRGAEPAMTVREMEEALRRTALDIGASGEDGDSGAGLVNVAAALDLYRQMMASGDPDWDADGSPRSADCDDWTASVHPGAEDIKHDGIDQDCNGYDLTIDVVSAVWDARRQTLDVVATSGYGAAAGLEVIGLGPMKFASRKGVETWTLSARKVSSPPSPLTVSGPEGAVSVSVGGS